MSRHAAVGAPWQVGATAVVFGALLATAAAADDSLPLDCTGEAVQGGLVRCRTAPAADIHVNATLRTRADEHGLVTLGIGRDEAGILVVSAEQAGRVSAPVSLPIAARDFAYAVVDGLDCSKVSVFTPSQLEEIALASEKKDAAFGTFVAGAGAHDGFVPPAQGRHSSAYGSRRRLTGKQEDGVTCEKTRTHWGLDIAVPEGTPIHAPAAGVVTLADSLYFEGNAVFLDHGQGLQSVFMHMSAIEVVAGQRVQAGDVLGRVGMTGTATGPHLHWGIKVRNPASDDRAGDFYVDPIQALALTPAPFDAER